MATQTLGFYDLMNIAEQNSEQSERDASKLKFPSFKASKNKKEDTKSKALSENVRKFLAKQEDEKRKREEAERLKRQNLLEIRSKDKKSKKRVNQMLKMTKSSNKSAMADAVNSLNDSIVDQHDVLQPDDDDYGYVSQNSLAMHNKLLDQYRNIKKSDPLPPQRIQNVPIPEVKSITSKAIGKEPTPIKAVEIKKKKKNVASSLSYHDLLALAKVQKDLPEVVIKKVQEKEKRYDDEFEYGRPMTAKEKMEYQADKALRERVAKQIENGTFILKAGSSTEKKDTSKPSQAETFKIPTKKHNIGTVPVPPKPIPSSTVTKVTSVSGKVTTDSQRDRDNRDNGFRSERIENKKKSEIITRAPVQSKSKNNESERNGRNPIPPNTYIDNPPRRTAVCRDPSPQRSRPPQISNRHNHHELVNPKDRARLENGVSPSQSVRRDKSPPTKKSNVSSFRTGNENHVLSQSTSTKSTKGKVSSSNEFKTPERKIEEGSFQEQVTPKMNNYTAEDWKNVPSRLNAHKIPMKDNQKYGGRVPPNSNTNLEDRKPATSRDSIPESSNRKGRQIIDSDDDEGEGEEYDSEMDDFIDDSDCNPNHISAMIRQITGYDKRRYHPEDEGECMETSAYDQMREESRSLRIGIQEDLEDMRLEEEERKRKLVKQKQAKKRPRV